MIKYNHTPSVINQRPLTWVALCLRCGVTLFIYMCEAIVIYAMKIKLTQGKFASVGYWWYEWLNQWKWRTAKSINTCYAIRSKQINGKKKMIFMHSVILKPKSDNSLVDHKDRDGLNNLEHNLRECTHTQNMQNRSIQKNNKSGFHGVHKKVSESIHKGVSYKYESWAFAIRVNGITIRTSGFKDKISAAKAYDELAKKYFGEFANLNFKEAPTSKPAPYRLPERARKGHTNFNPYVK